VRCDIAAARNFVYANARLLEQRVFAAWFEGGAVGSVVAAVAAYQNVDGGFGHGLEPDKRAPESQPLDVEIAFERLAMVEAHAPELLTAACVWLATIAAPTGAVPIVLPSIAGYPRAEHWDRNEYEPDLNPTAAIAAHVHALGVTHPWADRATDYSFAEIEAGRAPDEAHSLLGLAKLVEHAPDRQRALDCADRLASALTTARFMNMDPAADSYGLSPLDFAPAPDTVAHSWFDDHTVTAHLDQLESEQCEDGGWPITWQPLSEATRYEWRGIRTLNAVRVLNAYQRTTR